MSDYLPAKRKFKSSFDIIPNEIFLHIFDYLTSNDIIYSFFGCNQRLQNLLLTQKYHLKIPTTDLNFWNKTLPIIGSQIQTLVIDNDYLTASLDLFSNLTSIIISSSYYLLDRQLKSILYHECFQQLHTFKIKDAIIYKKSYNENVLDDEQILFKKIFDNNNNLQIFEYLPELEWLSYRKFDKFNSNIHIRSLILNFTDFPDIPIFIQHTPNLIYLNIQSEMPYEESGQRQSTDISHIKLEELHFKFKPYDSDYEDSRRTRDCDQLFHLIELFSSSLITLSLNFIDVYELKSTNVLFNGIELENKLLKPMKKLRNFYFYAGIDKYKNAQILSTFQTFPSSIGVHKSGCLYSLPFPFHELKKFRNFQGVLSNNDDILKDDHRLWSNVRSLELMPIDQNDLKSSLPLIKHHMPKLSSITFRDDSSYNPSSSTYSWNEIERINVELNSVTTVCLRGISTKKIQQILMYSFPNLQCIILDRTVLPSKENELTSFLGQKIQRMISYEYFSVKNITQETDISYLCNLKHLKLSYYGSDNGEKLNSRSRIISNLLTKLRKLETLSIYAISGSSANSKSIFDEIMNGLDEDEIKTEYEIKYSGNCIRFIRNSVS